LLHDFGCEHEDRDKDPMSRRFVNGGEVCLKVLEVANVTKSGTVEGMRNRNKMGEFHLWNWSSLQFWTRFMMSNGDVYTIYTINEIIDKPRPQTYKCAKQV